MTSLFWEIIDNISEMVQDIHYNERLIENHVWPIEWHDCQWPWVKMKVTFAVLNHCNTHNSENIACFNYSMFTRKLESARGLWLKFYCQRCKTSKGHRQSRTLEKYSNISETVQNREFGNSRPLTGRILVYGLSNSSNCIMTLSALKVIPLLLAISSVIFHICCASRGPSALAELLVFLRVNNHHTALEKLAASLLNFRVVR